MCEDNIPKNNRSYHSHTKRDILDDARTVSYCYLQNVENHRVVGLEQYRNLKNGGIQDKFPIY